MSDVPPNQGQPPQQPAGGPPPQQQPAGQQPHQQPAGGPPPQQPGGQPPPQQPAGGPPPQQPGGQQPPPQYQQPQQPYQQPYQQPAGQPGAVVGGPADLATRFFAKLIDWVLLGVVLGIVWAIAASIFISSALSGGFAFGGGGGFMYSLLLTIISTALVLGYFIFMESSRGQTVGKMLLKIKVQTANGSNPSMEEAAKRNAYMAIYIANVIPWVGWLIGSLGLLAANIYIAVTINNDTQARRGWHDEFGGTQVIKVG